MKQTISFQKLDESVPEKQKDDIRETYNADIQDQLEKVASDEQSNVTALRELVSKLSVSQQDPPSDAYRYNTIGAYLHLLPNDYAILTCSNKKYCMGWWLWLF